MCISHDPKGELCLASDSISIECRYSDEKRRLHAFDQRQEITFKTNCFSTLRGYNLHAVLQL